MAAKIIFTTAATFTRLSLHCFYYRLVADTGRSWFKWCIHLNVAYTVGIEISFMYVCVKYSELSHQSTDPRQLYSGLPVYPSLGLLGDRLAGWQLSGRRHRDPYLWDN